MIRCGLAVPGQRRPRCCSQARSRLAGQVVERAGPAGDDQPPAAEVGVAEMKLPDGLGPGGVHGGQGDREAGGRGDGGGGGLVDLGGLQRLDEVQGPLAVADAAGGVAEDRAGLLGVAEQRPQGGKGLQAPARGQEPGGGDDVGGGDLAQVAVVPGPGQQQRVDPVEVHPDGVLVAGTAAGPALARVRSQCRTSAAISAGSGASRAEEGRDGPRAPSPARTLVMLTRGWAGGGRRAWDHGHRGHRRRAGLDRAGRRIRRMRRRGRPGAASGDGADRGQRAGGRERGPGDPDVHAVPYFAVTHDATRGDEKDMKPG